MMQNYEKIKNYTLTWPYDKGIYSCTLPEESCLGLSTNLMHHMTKLMEICLYLENKEQPNNEHGVSVGSV
jgi:hypothetical protein